METDEDGVTVEVLLQRCSKNSEADLKILRQRLQKSTAVVLRELTRRFRLKTKAHFKKADLIEQLLDRSVHDDLSSGPDPGKGQGAVSLFPEGPEFTLFEWLARGQENSQD